MIDTIKTEIQKVIIGQENLVDNLLIGLITGGHILVESVPGLAKTTAINTLAKALGIDFKRHKSTTQKVANLVLNKGRFLPTYY